MSDNGVNTCKHCGVHIVKERSVFGWEDVWVHQPEGASLKDGRYVYCKNTVATPEEKHPVTNDQKAIYKYLHDNPGKNYVDLDSGNLYVLIDGGMLCFDGEFGKMTDEEIARFLEKYREIEKKRY